MSSPRLNAVIFDMDGVLIDSEPVWQIAERKVLRSLGLDLKLADMSQTTGLRIDQVVTFWYQRFPWENYDNQQVAKAIIEQVVEYIKREGKPMPGVTEALSACQKNKLKIGLATSSSSDIVKAVLNKLNIGHYFESWHSAEHLSYGKPHPEVYLNCAAALGIAPTACLAIEDSFNGLIAARAANMQTIAIPENTQADDQKWVIAHQQLNDLKELPNYLEELLETK